MLFKTLVLVFAIKAFAEVKFTGSNVIYGLPKNCVENTFKSVIGGSNNPPNSYQNGVSCGEDLSSNTWSCDINVLGDWNDNTLGSYLINDAIHLMETAASPTQHCVEVHHIYYCDEGPPCKASEIIHSDAITTKNDAVCPTCTCTVNCQACDTIYSVNERIQLTAFEDGTSNTEAQLTLTASCSYSNSNPYAILCDEFFSLINDAASSIPDINAFESDVTNQIVNGLQC
ncbi:hypothetical protein HDU84_009690 [Entophlyctis sp. JEL0112]|nr:hypothetical protein HDU84_009690 [Entophlyctis sp. JEL0112]